MGFREKLNESFPKGFHPTDEEIIEDLQHEVLNQSDECIIPHVDVHEQDEPWDLATMINGKWERTLKEWCFIRSWKEKYKTGKRLRRTTRSGYWKVTGKERGVWNEATNEITGAKKTLVFYTGRVPKGKRTNWVMHECHLSPKFLAKHNKQDKMHYVGCRLRKKKDKKGAKGGTSPSGQADDRSRSSDNSNSNSNTSNVIMESRMAEDDPISMSDSPDSVFTEGSAVIVEDGSHSICNIAPEPEIAEIHGNGEIDNNLGLGEEQYPCDSDYVDCFCPSEFFGDLGAEHGGGSSGDGSDDEWISFIDWDNI